jgi:hypothetical protein
MKIFCINLTLVLRQAIEKFIEVRKFVHLQFDVDSEMRNEYSSLREICNFRVSYPGKTVG